MLEDTWYLEKMSHFNREVIPERRMHAKGSGAFGTFSVTHDITKYTKADLFSLKLGSKPIFLSDFPLWQVRGAQQTQNVIFADLQ